jgi:hypothetical protein
MPILRREMRNRLGVACAFLIGVTLFTGCGTTRHRAKDAQCGSFCERIDECLGDSYDDDLKNKLCDMARCESGCRANAKSPAGYVGPYQFAAKSWKYLCYPVFEKKALMGRCGSTGAMRDVCCSSICTAEVVSQGRSGHWPNCGR